MLRCLSICIYFLVFAFSDVNCYNLNKETYEFIKKEFEGYSVECLEGAKRSCQHLEIPNISIRNLIFTRLYRCVESYFLRHQDECFQVVNGQPVPRPVVTTPRAPLGSPRANDHEAGPSGTSDNFDLDEFFANSLEW